MYHLLWRKKICLFTILIIRRNTAYSTTIVINWINFFLLLFGPISWGHTPIRRSNSSVQLTITELSRSQWPNLWRFLFLFGTNFKIILTQGSLDFWILLTYPKVQNIFSYYHYYHFLYLWKIKRFGKDPPSLRVFYIYDVNVTNPVISGWEIENIDYLLLSRLSREIE